MFHQVIVTIRAALRPGRTEEVASLLDARCARSSSTNGGPLVDLPGVIIVARSAPSGLDHQPASDDGPG